MSLTTIPYDAPHYQALSTDISGGSISGASYVGATVYVTDTHTWYQILPDLSLELLYYNITSGSSV